MKMKKTHRRHHSLVRVYQRAGVQGDNALRFIQNAKRKGMNIGFYADVPGLEDFHTYLLNKTRGGKNVKVYNGFVFILNKTNKTGTGCITMYPIPTEFVGIVKEYETSCVRWSVSFHILYPQNVEGKFALEKLDGTLRGEDVDDDDDVFEEIRQKFASFARSLGLCEMFCVKRDGTIQHNFTRVGTWEVKKCLKK